MRSELPFGFCAAKETVSPLLTIDGQLIHSVRQAGQKHGQHAVRHAVEVDIDARMVRCAQP